MTPIEIAQLAVNAVVALIVLDELVLKKRRAKLQDAVDEVQLMGVAQIEQRARVADAQLDAQRARTSAAETLAELNGMKLQMLSMKHDYEEKLAYLDAQNKSKGLTIARLRNRVRLLEETLSKAAIPFPPEPEETKDEQPTG